MNDTITITVNGRTAASATRELKEYIYQIREELGLGPETPLAVELNGAVIPAGEYGHHRLKNGDTLELIHFVGGG